MLNKLLKHKFKILITILVVFCFGVIRAFETEIFYDPFLSYFESDFKDLAFPQIDSVRLFYSLLLRYVLNAVLSIILIYTLFQDLEIMKFSVFLYVFFLVLLLGIFMIIVNYLPEANWLLFYVRRFIIQPIFVLLFVPAFYYQQQNHKK